VPRNIRQVLVLYVSFFVMAGASLVAVENLVSAGRLLAIRISAVLHSSISSSARPRTLLEHTTSFSP
jgi:hypothetical protein